jgi:hypothetical protein
MAKVTESEIKDALVAVDKARRQANEHLLRAKRAERARIRSATEKLLIPYWKQSGLDVAAFRQIQEQAQAELRRIAGLEKQRIIGDSASVAARLRHSENSLSKTVNSFRTAGGNLAPNFVPPVFDVVWTPSMIMSTSGLELDQSHIEPQNNWAKVKGQWSSGANESLQFVFMWTNPSDRYSLVNVGSFLTLNGCCQVGADGGFGGIFPGSTTTLHLYAVLDILEFWNQPTTEFVSSPTEILNFQVNGGGWFGSVGAIETQSVGLSTGDIRFNMLLVPPNGAAAFVVTLRADVTIDDSGSAEVDFSSGNFEVRCPFVAIPILS